jgi:hypothetical protein
MKTSWYLAALGALGVAGCGHVKDSQIISLAEKPSTIMIVDTIDTARLRSDENTKPEAAARELAELIAAHMATVGIVHAPVSSANITVELPAPGWLLRARLSMRPELFCMLTLEPLATQPAEHAVQAAPWSVLDAFERVHRGVIALRPPKELPIPLERFNRLREEATMAATENRDPPLTQNEYMRTPRPISEQPDRPYYTPPASDVSTLKEAP